MILTRHDGQEVLDGLSALSLSASTLMVARWGSVSALRSRLVFVFGGLCAFYATRAAFGALGSHVLEVANQTIACAMPLAALLLVEGVLRRHAPAALKFFVTVGALAVALALLFPATRFAATKYGLATFVLVSLAWTTALLVARDRPSLSHQENAGVDALVVPGILLTLLTVSDFLPQAPVGLSGVGCAMLAFVLAANPSGRREARGVLVELSLIACVALTTEAAFAHVLHIPTVQQQVRFGAVLIALLLASAAVVRVRQAREEHTAQSFVRALALADTASLDGFLDSVADQSLLSGLRLADGAQLAEYDCGGLAAALAARNVWTRRTLRDETVASRAREELGDLMTRNDATHAVMISREPLRIALFVLPAGGRPGVAETDLSLFGKLAAIAATERHAAEFR